MLKHTATVILGMMSAGSAVASPLDDLRWTHRVLLVFAAPGDVGLAEQTAILSSVPAGAIEGRDLVVLMVPPDGETKTLFGEPTGPFSAAALRRAYDATLPEVFEALLVGKDGGTKWRERRPARAAEIVDLIDSMPMRRQEMHGNGKLE